MNELITHSRLDSFKTCRKKHWFSYEQRVRTIDDAKALRMGSAHHEAIEALATGKGIEVACQLVRDRYALLKVNAYDLAEVEYEEETLLRLACGYEWRWTNDALSYVSVEQSFRLPLINPETGRRTPLFDLAGKIDGIVRLPDGRLAVKESKLYGEEIGSDAPLWKRMRLDLQVSLYVLAARQLGHDVDTVLYDVTQKPTIKPTQVPILDELGMKVVLDGGGTRIKTQKGFWRETGSTADGFVLQTRPMTPTEWGEKLSADIASKPDRYFHRQEIPRLQQDLDEFSQEIWELQQVIRDAQLKDRWYRTVNKNSCSWCAYFDLCCNRWEPGGELPESFRVLEDANPELV